MTAVRVGTRGSLLARTQTGHVSDWLIANEMSVETHIIRTAGDDQSLELHRAPEPGVFVSALRDALRNHEVDCIVHSLKDLPSEAADGIRLAAIPLRVDPRDVLIGSASLRELPAGAIIGTSSPRRTAFIARERPDIDVRPIRGNIDTRISKVRSGEYDAVILAAAGLLRIARFAEITEFFDVRRCIPAPAQGSLAVECRDDDTKLSDLLVTMIDSASWWNSHAERAVLRGVAATCATAVGAHVVDGILLADLAIDGIYTRTEIPCGDFEWADEAGLAAAHQLVDTR